MLVNCPACGSENVPHRRYCRTCGRAMGTACRTCSFFNQAGDAFCGGCGEGLDPGNGGGAKQAAAGAAQSTLFLTDDMGLGDAEIQDLLSEGAAPQEEEEDRMSPSEIESLFDGIDREGADGE